MLAQYDKSTASQSEVETMKVLHFHWYDFNCFNFFFAKLIYDELAKKQPNVIKLAAETDDNDDGIGMHQPDSLFTQNSVSSV